MKLKFAHQDLIMHPSGCLYWPSKELVMIADVHFGKIEHFRKHGSALPTQVGLKNFQKLNQVVNEFQPKYLFFLGDLFHSTQNKDWDRFASWVKTQRLNISLIVGNHDIIPKYQFEELGINVYSHYTSEKLYLTHHPETKDGFYNICGHLHPGYRLKGVGRQNLKLSCFYKKETQLIIPAFGAFTGHFLIEPEENEDIFILAEEEVLSLR